jgi:hypothetical protein
LIDRLGSAREAEAKVLSVVYLEALSVFGTDAEALGGGGPIAA